MKRDLDLCRDIMLAIEAKPPGAITTFSLEREVDLPTAMAHLQLLFDAGLLNGECHFEQGGSGGCFIVEGITWAGHDFIDSARSEGIWSKTKDRLKKAGSWTFGLMMDVLKDEAKHQLGDLLT